MKRSHGPNSKRSRNLRSKGRVAITKFLQEFEEGDKVRIDINTNVLRGRPTTLRFNRLNGVVIARRGKGYEIEIKDGDKKKRVVVINAHLVKA